VQDLCTRRTFAPAHCFCVDLAKQICMPQF
jgi:hypothetical protein